MPGGKAPARSDAAAWAAFRAELLARVRGRGLNPAEAEDVVQTVIARLLANGATPVEPSRLPAWLGTVTRNAVADHWRRVGRLRGREISWGETGGLPEQTAGKPVGGPDEGDDGPLGRAAMLDCLAPLMAGLSEADRTALWLADAEGRPQADVAARLGIGLSGAKSRIQRARRRLADRLERCCAIERDVRGRATTLIARAACCRAESI
jgi:RNA polymerase sigma-70 factor (ECF subfamily)